MSNNTKLVAIMVSTVATAKAIEGILGPRMPGADFVHYTKYSDIPAETERPNQALASIGLPNFLSTNKSHEVHVLNTKYSDNEETKKAQWDLLRNENATPEEIIAVLGSPETYKVFPSASVLPKTIEYKDARIALAEAKDDAERLVALQQMHDVAMTMSAI